MGRLNPKVAIALHELGCEGFTEEELEARKRKDSKGTEKEVWTGDDSVEDVAEKEEEPRRFPLFPHHPSSLSADFARPSRFLEERLSQYARDRRQFDYSTTASMLEQRQAYNPAVRALLERQMHRQEAPVRRGADPDGLRPSEVYPEDEKEMIENSRSPRSFSDHPRPFVSTGDAQSFSDHPRPFVSTGDAQSSLPPRNVMSLLQPLEAVPRPRVDPRVLAFLRQRPYKAPLSSIEAFRKEQIHQQGRASDGSSQSSQFAQRYDEDDGDDSSSTEKDEESGVGRKGAYKRAPKKTWEERMMQMREFFRKYGHVQVSTRGEHRELGRWLSSMRGKARTNSLPRNRLKEFLEMQEWTTENPDVKDRCFPVDVARREASPQGGSTSWGQEEYSDDDYDGPNANMTSTGSPSNSAPPPPGNIKKRKRARHSYETRVQLIKIYKEEHGHCRVSVESNDKLEEQLARWLASARCRHKAGQFKPERAEELRQLGCEGFEPNDVLRVVRGDPNPTNSSWDTRAATPSPSPEESDREVSEPSSTKMKLFKTSCRSWEDMFDELKAYQLVFGASDPIPETEGEGGKLGRWLALQRRQFFASKLPQDRMEKLQSLRPGDFAESDLGARVDDREAEAMVAA